MNLFNSVRTRPVSRKNHSPKTFILKTSPDGQLVRVELDNKPILSNAEDFSIENMQKTGVTFDAPQGAFIKPTSLQASDNILNASSELVNIPEPSSSSESSSSSEPSPSPDPSTSQES